MKASEKLRATVGGNIAESIETHRPVGVNTAVPALAGKLAGLDRVRGAYMVPLDRLRPDPAQPRKDFDPEALGRLAESLKARGQLMPARVRWSETDGVWYVVAGERRLRAAALAGLPALACVEAPAGLTPQEVLAEQLTENCVREDLRPVEQAEAFEALMNHRGWSQRALAAFLHVAPSTVSRTLALLRLPGDIREAVDAGAVPVETAREAATGRDPGAREARRAAIRGALRSGAPARRRSASYTFEEGEVRVFFRDPEPGPGAAATLLRRALDAATGPRRRGSAA